jgi:hypothetical protein
MNQSIDQSVGQSIQQVNPTRLALQQKRDEYVKQIADIQDQIKKIEAVLPLFPEPLTYFQTAYQNQEGPGVWANPMQANPMLP